MSQEAFPSPGVVLTGEPNERHQGAYAGMLLRDFFAAKALGSLVLALSTEHNFTDACASEAADCDLCIEDYVSARAYDWAEAMLAARSKP